MDVQARLFPTLAAIHYCILERDPIEIADILPPSDDGFDVEDHGQLATEYPGWAEKTEPMLDMKRSQRVCGMTTRQCFASKICSLIAVTQ